MTAHAVLVPRKDTFPARLRALDCRATNLPQQPARHKGRLSHKSARHSSRPESQATNVGHRKSCGKHPVRPSCRPIAHRLFNNNNTRARGLLQSPRQLVFTQASKPRCVVTIDQRIWCLRRALHTNSSASLLRPTVEVEYVDMVLAGGSIGVSEAQLRSALL